MVFNATFNNISVMSKRYQRKYFQAKILNIDSKYVFLLFSSEVMICKHLIHCTMLFLYNRDVMSNKIKYLVFVVILLVIVAQFTYIMFMSA